MEAEASLIDYALRVAEVLEQLKIKYALVGGLACILMGVRRVTEDADFIIELNSVNDAKKLAQALLKAGFSIPLNEVIGAYYNQGHFTILVGDYRMDFKIAKTRLDHETLNNSVRVHIRCKNIRIARLEENIVAKIMVLKSIKDIEDALKLIIMYYDKLNWHRVRELACCDVLREVERMLNAIKEEFKENVSVQKKIAELESILAKIRERSQTIL